MSNPIDYPWALVRLYNDVWGVTVYSYATEAEAHEAKKRRSGNVVEQHVVPLPDLLAWVRANAREGRT